MFENLIEWSKLSLRQRYNLLLGAVIVVLGGFIQYQHKEHLDYVRDCRTDKKNLQDKIDDQKEERLRYLQQMSDDYIRFLNEINRIKSQSHEKTI